MADEWLSRRPYIQSDLRANPARLQKKPSAGEILGANMMLENDILSVSRAVNSLAVQSVLPQTPGYVVNPNEVPDFIPIESVYHARSKSQLDYLIKNKTQEHKWRETQGAGGLSSVPAALVAGAISPTTLWGPALALKTSAGIAKGTLIGAGAGFGGVGVQELGLWGSQSFRTGEEVAAGILGGTAFSGLLGGVAGGFSKRALRQLRFITRNTIEQKQLELVVDPNTQKYHLWNDNARRVFEERQAEQFAKGEMGISPEEVQEILIRHGDSFDNVDDLNAALAKQNKAVLSGPAIDAAADAAEPFVRELGFSRADALEELLNARTDGLPADSDVPLPGGAAPTTVRTEVDNLKANASAENLKLENAEEFSLEDLILQIHEQMRRVFRLANPEKDVVDPLTGRPLTEQELFEQSRQTTGRDSMPEGEFEERRGQVDPEYISEKEKLLDLHLQLARRFYRLTGEGGEEVVNRVLGMPGLEGRSPRSIAGVPVVGADLTGVPRSFALPAEQFEKFFNDTINNRYSELESNRALTMEQEARETLRKKNLAFSEDWTDPAAALTSVMQRLVDQEQKNIMRIALRDPLTPENQALVDNVKAILRLGQDQELPEQLGVLARQLEYLVPQYQTMMRRLTELSESTVPLSAEDTAYKIALQRHVQMLARKIADDLHQIDAKLDVEAFGKIKESLIKDSRRLQIAMSLNLPRQTSQIINEMGDYLVSQGEYAATLVDAQPGVYGAILVQYSPTGKTRVVDMEGAPGSLQQRVDWGKEAVARYEKIVSRPDSITVDDYYEELSFGIPNRIVEEPSREEILALFQDRVLAAKDLLRRSEDELAGKTKPVGATHRVRKGRFVGSSRGAYYFEPGMSIVTVDPAWARSSFEAKAWGKPAVEGVDPLGDENLFGTWLDWMDFVTEHEKAHARHRRRQGESYAEYENRINQIGYATYVANKSDQPRKTRTVSHVKRLLKEFAEVRAERRETRKIRQSRLDPKPASFDSTVYHGTRSGDIESFVDSEGNLILRSSSNFDGRMIGVSFSPTREVSEDYASRIARNKDYPSPRRDRAQGMVFEINADALPEGRMLEMDGSESLAEGTEDVVIPAGQWRVTRDAEAIRQRDTRLTSDTDRIEELEDSIDEYVREIEYDLSEAEADDLNEMRNELELLKNRQTTVRSKDAVDVMTPEEVRLAEELQAYLSEMERVDNDIAEARGLLHVTQERLADAESVIQSIASGKELSSFAAAELRLHVEDAKIFLDAENYLEWQIDLQNSAIDRIRDEQVADANRTTDSRPVTVLTGIGKRLAARLKNANINTVQELITALVNNVEIKGIGVGTATARRLIAEAVIQEDLQKVLLDKMSAAKSRRDALRTERIALQEKREKSFLERLEEGQRPERAVSLSVQRAIGGLETHLGRIFSTPEQRILNASPFRASKNFYLELVDANLLFDQNTTGEFSNPYNVQNRISKSMSLTVRALKNGPGRQWKLWVEGKNPDGSSGGLSPDAMRARQSISHAEFREMVGMAMHDENYHKRITPDIAPYVKAAANTMRTEYYLPMLNAWEDAYGATPHVNPMSYLLRLYNMQKILGKEKEFAQAAYNDMMPKIRSFLNTDSPDAARFYEKMGRVTEDGEEWESFLEKHLTEKIEKWIEAITTEPVDRAPSTSQKPGQGRPARTRRAFEIWLGSSDDSVFKLAEIDIETLAPYLKTDIDEVTAVYQKTRVPDMAIVSKFGDIRASGKFAELEAEYQSKVQEIEQTVSPEKKEQALKDLAAAYASDKHDFEAMIDIIRGVYNVPPDPHSFPAYLARASNVLKSITYMRLGGGFGITAIGDVGSSMLVNGFVRTSSVLFEEMRNGVGKAAMSMPQKDLEHLLIDLDDSLHTRIASAFDYDPWGPTPSVGENLLSQGATAMAHASLLMPWTNQVKHIGAKATIRKIAEISTAFSKGNNINPNELALLRSRGGFNEEDILAIAANYDHYGTGQDGTGAVSLGVESWGRETRMLKEKIKRIIIADSDRTAPAPRVGDKPLFMHRTTGSLLFMFKSFGFGLTSKLLIPALQGVPYKDYRVFNYLGASIALGSMVYILKQIVSKREVPDDLERIIQEGVVRSDAWGKLVTVDEFTSTFTPMPSVLGTVGPDTHFNYEGSSWIMDATEAALGPAVSTGIEFGRATGAAVNAMTDPQGLGAASDQQVRALRKIQLFNTLFYADWGFDMMENGLLSYAAQKRLETPSKESW